MSNLHRDLDEFNLHNPKGFNPATPNTFATKSEQGSSYYEERMQLPKVINIVDGNLPAPSTADLDAFIIIDGGGGVLDLSWGPSSFNDWVRFNGGVPYRISPLAGYLAYNENGSQWKEFDGSNWVDFGGGGVVNTLYTADGTLTGARTVTMSGFNLAFEGGVSTFRGTATGEILRVENSLGNRVFRVAQDGTSNDGTVQIYDDTGVTTLISLNGLHDTFNTGNNFGINTSTPLKDFHVQASANGNGIYCYGAGTESSKPSGFLRHINNATAMGGALGIYRNDGTTLAVSMGGNSTTVSYINDDNNFGIGITTPTAKLHVKGAGSTSGTTALLVQNSLSTNLLEVLDDGTVGIGTTPVANQPLTVTAAERYAFVSSGNFNNSGSISGASLTSTSTATNNIIGLELNSATNTSWLGTTNNSVSASFSGLDNATLIFNNGTSGKGINLVANTASGVIRMMTGGNNERVIVDNAGNVGIGYTNPTVKLAVNGDSHINGKLAINGTTFATNNHVTIDNVSEPFAIGASSSWNNFGSIGGIRLETTSAAVNNGIGISLSSNTNNNTLLGNTGANVTGGFTGLESSYLVYNSGTNSKGINLVSRGTNASIKLRSTTTTSGEAPVSLLIDSSGGVQINNNLGLFGTTPIAQPTTAGGSATFAANTSGISDDTATFDGYTIGQVVKALRDLGILA